MFLSENYIVTLSAVTLVVTLGLFVPNAEPRPRDGNETTVAPCSEVIIVVPFGKSCTSKMSPGCRNQCQTIGAQCRIPEPAPSSPIVNGEEDGEIHAQHVACSCPPGTDYNVTQDECMALLNGDDGSGGVGQVSGLLPLLTEGDEEPLNIEVTTQEEGPDDSELEERLANGSDGDGVDLDSRSSSNSTVNSTVEAERAAAAGEDENGQEPTKQSNVAWVIGGITAAMFVLILVFIARKRIVGVFRRGSHRIPQNDNDNY